MKIIHIISNLEIGGAQRLIENLIPYFKKGNDISVIVFRKTNSEIEKNIEKFGAKIINLNISYRSPKAIFKLYKYLKKSDVIHLHLFPANYYGVIANLMVGKPVIFTEHSTFNKRRKYPFLRVVEKFIYGRINKIVSISQGVEKNLKEWLDFRDEDERFIVIENGVKPPLDFKTDSEIEVSEDRIREDRIREDRIKEVLMISRFTSSKDQDTVIKSLKYLQGENLCLVFAGDGERLETVKKLAIKEGVSDKVKFLGSCNNISELIANATIGVQSSHWEGFGLSAIEMMVSGLPVIASDVEGLRDVVNNAGLLFERGNEKELAEKIKTLLLNRSLYNKIRRQCIKRGKEYHIEKTAEKYLNLYKSLEKTFRK